MTDEQRPVAPPRFPTGVTFTGLHDEDGTEVWLVDTSREEKTEESEKRYVPPGKVEAPTYGLVSFEIPSESIVKECHVTVENDVEGSQYLCGMPLVEGSIVHDGPWFTVYGEHWYQKGKRVLSCRLKNWAHGLGRHVWIFVRYDTGTRVKVIRNEKGERVIEKP